jgi:hypothetical protein
VKITLEERLFQAIEDAVKNVTTDEAVPFDTLS